MIPQEVIEEIRERVNIVHIIGEVVPLKRAGKDYSGLCPFHQEKTPSFTVSETKQLYHCFGCGEGGTVFTFLSKFHRLSFPEALEKLAGHAGMDLAPFKKNRDQLDRSKELKKGIYTSLQYARDFYHQTFMQWPKAEHAREYAKKRGMSRETVKGLMLGYAPQDGKTLYQVLKRDGQNLQDAEKAGLIRTCGSEYTDVFRDRLLFPIADAEGRTIGFGGRVLSEQKPKYLNSAQTPVFDKRRTLFGLNIAAEAARKEKKLIVVEGYMDWSALYSAGFPNVVATLGTSLTEDHTRILRRYCDEVVLVFDGDRAGVSAARRSIRPLWSEGLSAKVVSIPSGQDPDDYLKEKGAEALAHLIEESEPLMDFYLDSFYHSETNLSGKTQVIEELASVVQAAKTPFIQEALVDQLSKKTGLSKEVLRGKERARFSATPPRQAAPVRGNEPGKITNEELVLLKLAAEVPETRERLQEEQIFDFFSSQDFAEQTKAWIEKIGGMDLDHATASTLVDAWEEEDSRKIVAKALMDVSVTQEQWERVWGDCVKKLRSRKIRRLSKEVADADQSGDQETMFRLMKRMEELKRMDV